MMFVYFPPGLRWIAVIWYFTVARNVYNILSSYSSWKSQYMGSHDNGVKPIDFIVIQSFSCYVRVLFVLYYETMDNGKTPTIELNYSIIYGLSIIFLLYYSNFGPLAVHMICRYRIFKTYCLSNKGNHEHIFSIKI